jgi:chromosome segregation ATPase
LFRILEAEVASLKGQLASVESALNQTRNDLADMTSMFKRQTQYSNELDAKVTELTTTLTSERAQHVVDLEQMRINTLKAIDYLAKMRNFYDRNRKTRLKL